jgi:twitching motility protein PilT
MRDAETIETSLRLAETGHLTLSTLHTRSAPDTIGRILDMFPPAHQGRIQSLLSSVLEGIVCQTLAPCRDGAGRDAAVEVLIPNPAIRNLIRENKLHQIRSAMQMGQAGSGMCTLNQSLAKLFLSGRISYETCLEFSQDTADLQRCLDLG